MLFRSVSQSRYCGVENGKIIYCDDKFYCALDGSNTIMYQHVDLKFRKSIRQPQFEKDYVLNQPLKIYVPKSEYDEYEGALKFILSKWMEAEWDKM